MPRQLDPALEEAGLTEEAVATSIQKVFGMMISSAEPAGEEQGWLAVVKAASDVFGGGGDSEIVISLPEAADFFRLAYGRALDPDYQAAPAGTLVPAIRDGWQAVTRHLTNLFNLDPQEARKLEQHESRIVEFVKARSSATPK